MKCVKRLTADQQRLVEENLTIVERVLRFDINANPCVAGLGYEDLYLAKSELEKKLPTYFEDALAMCRTRQRKVEILCEGESVPIPVQSLAWIESHGREQYLHLVGGCREQLITRLTMTQLEDLLVPHGFLRIHKSYLVNMAYLQSFQSTSAVLTVGQTLPVGARSYRDNKQKFVRWQAQQLW